MNGLDIVSRTSDVWILAWVSGYEITGAYAALKVGAIPLNALVQSYINSEAGSVNWKSKKNVWNSTKKSFFGLGLTGGSLVLITLLIHGFITKLILGNGFVDWSYILPWILVTESFNYLAFMAQNNFQMSMPAITYRKYLTYVAGLAILIQLSGAFIGGFIGLWFGILIGAIIRLWVFVRVLRKIDILKSNH